MVFLGLKSPKIGRTRTVTKNRVHLADQQPRWLTLYRRETVHWRMLVDGVVDNSKSHLCLNKRRPRSITPPNSFSPRIPCQNYIEEDSSSKALSLGLSISMHTPVYQIWGRRCLNRFALRANRPRGKLWNRPEIGGLWWFDFRFYCLVISPTTANAPAGYLPTTTAHSKRNSSVRVMVLVPENSRKPIVENVYNDVVFGWIHLFPQYFVLPIPLEVLPVSPWQIGWCSTLICTVYWWCTSITHYHSANYVKRILILLDYFKNEMMA